MISVKTIQLLSLLFVMGEGLMFNKLPQPGGRVRALARAEAATATAAAAPVPRAQRRQRRHDGKEFYS